MTILPTKRSANSNNEEKTDGTSQNVNNDRSSRRRDDHSISHSGPSLNDANSSVSRRSQFSFNGSPTERKDRSFRKRYKEAKIDRSRDREREREQMRDIRREQKRDRKAKRENATEKSDGPSSSGNDSSLSEPTCNDRENQMEIGNDEDVTGFNSEDEYDIRRKPAKEKHLTEEEWAARDVFFSRCLAKLGFEIKEMNEDGACLFRAIADQVYGDQELHLTVRTQCMDYIVKNKDFFTSYVTEDFDKYVARKRKWNVHGNHLEIQALSEMYNRTIEVYCYHTEPINIFNGSRINAYEPIRVSYHRMCHYNSINNPKRPSILLGLGLPSYINNFDLDGRQVNDAVQESEELLIEQTMLEDKLKATDWEATYEALEEQVARESYIQYYRDAEHRLKVQGHSVAVPGSSSTITSAMCSSPRTSRRGSVSPKGSLSPKGGSSPKGPCTSSPRSLGCISPPIPSSFNSEGSTDNSAAVSYSSTEPQSGFDKNIQSVGPTNQNKSPKPVCDFDSEYAPYNTNCSISKASTSANIVVPNSSSLASCSLEGKKKDLSSDISLEDWDKGIMAQVLAESQQTYLEDLKRQAKKRYGSPGPSTSR